MFIEAATLALVISVASSQSSAIDPIAPGLVGLSVAGDAGPAITGDTPGPVRAAIEHALRGVDGWDVQPASYIDSVIQDFASAGVMCGATDDTCWLKFAVSAGLDVVILATIDGNSATLRLFDARDSRTREVKGPTATSAQLVRVLVAGRPASVLPKAPAVVPSGLPARAPNSSSKADADSSISPLMITSGVAGVAAVGCGVVAGVLELNAQATIANWDKGGSVDPAAFAAENAAELAFGGCAVVAGIAAIGAGALVLVTR